MNDFFSIPRSTYIKGFEWCGERIPYPDLDVKGNTFPITWADDGELYASAGDPLWGESYDGLDVEKFSGSPEDYTITKVNAMNDYKGFGGNGPKPSGMICVDGILYLAFQDMLKMKKAPYNLLSQHGSDAHIIYSTNYGSFWVPARDNIKEPMFPGHHFGGPSFINYGKNNENARDEYVYAVSADQWDNGSNLRIGRVNKHHIIEAAAWEWIYSYDASGNPAWINSLDEAIPILSMHRHIGLPEMVYLKGINRYLLLTWRLHKDFSPDDGTNLIIMESPEPWGPFSLVYMQEYWEGKQFNPYAPRVPLKWMEDDGVTGWIQFSGAWGSVGQNNYFYRSNVRKFRLIME